MSQEYFQLTGTRQTANLNCFINQNGEIINQTHQGHFKIGVTSEKQAQSEAAALAALEKAEQYEKLLIEHEIIKVPPTPEQQINTLTDLVNQQASQIAELLTELKASPKPPSFTPNEITESEVSNEQSN